MWSALFTVAVLVLVAVGSHWGIVGVALGYAGAHLVAASVALVMLRRSIAVDGSQVLRAMRAGVSLSVLVGGSIVLAMVVPGLSAPSRVAVALLAGGISLFFYVRYVGVGELGRAIERWGQEAPL